MNYMFEGIRNIVGLVFSWCVLMYLMPYYFIFMTLEYHTISIELGFVLLTLTSMIWLLESLYYFSEGLGQFMRRNYQHTLKYRRMK